MKTLLSLITLFLLSIGFASAQSTTTPGAATANGSDVSGYRAQNLTPDGKLDKSKPNPHPILKPKAGGVFVDGAKQGWIIISPAAPASYGIGQKYLSAPSPRADLQHESAYAAHRDSGGIKLFSWEF